jgi:Cft2 family RNA processing exonuclease
MPHLMSSLPRLRQKSCNAPQVSSIALQVDIQFTQKGIYLPELSLWLDPRDRCEHSWVSHGHSDHACGLHTTVIATPETLRVYRIRWPEDTEAPQELLPLAYGESVEWRGAVLTPFPASHILGAAQLLIEYGGERVVYTGDIKLREPICGSPTSVIPCDRLIIESTFGLPVYHFLSREAARERIVEFARECLDDGITPVFAGYPLGRGQEIAHVLCEAGIPTGIHGSIARMLPVYQAAGFAFPGWSPYDARQTSGKALVVVPDFRAMLEASGKNIRVAYVSGWAALDNARNRAGAEELIPYSDHADFEELLALVEGSGANHVDVVHGFTGDFARILNARGFHASAPREAAGRVDEAALDS